MSSELLRLEELGLKLEELKKDVEENTKASGLLDDKKRKINLKICNIDSEIIELKEKRQIKKNSEKLKNKNFFKLAKISMAIVFVISLLTDCIESISIGQTFPVYFNFLIFLSTVGVVVGPFHIVYIGKINKQCKSIDLEEINKLLTIKEQEKEGLQQERSSLENEASLVWKSIRSEQENIAVIKSEMKSIEHQINTNTKKDRRPMSKVKKLSLQEKIN